MGTRIWVEGLSLVAPPPCATKAVSFHFWRWRWGCWNSRRIVPAYPGAHEGIIPKAFQEMDPGFMWSQLMLALQIGACPNRAEAGHELSFILAIVQCFWLLIPCLHTHTHKLQIHFRPRDQQVDAFMHARRCSHKHTHTHKSCIITHRAA